jgi:DNA-binding MarR family transcriptional regulator
LNREGHEKRKKGTKGEFTGMEFTKKQGQYLAFIYHYTKINRRPPAEADIQWYFRVTPPTVHQMILRLEQIKLISRVPGQARTIKVLVPPEELPPLE